MFTAETTAFETDDTSSKCIYTATLDGDGIVSIARDGVWSGSGKWSTRAGGSITECAAVIPEEAYQMLEMQLASQVAEDRDLGTLTGCETELCRVKLQFACWAELDSQSRVDLTAVQSVTARQIRNALWRPYARPRAEEIADGLDDVAKAAVAKSFE